MDVDVACPQCGTVFTIKRELLGKRSKCTKCDTVFTLAESPRRPTPAPTTPPSPGASNVFSDIPVTPRPAPPEVPQFTIDPTPRATRPPTQPGEFFGFERDATQPRFPALRRLARAYEILAVLVLGFAAVLLLMFVIAVVSKPEPAAILGAVFASGLAFFWATLIASLLLVAAQTIRLWLQVEQNTRETQVACRQLADHLCSIETER